VLALRVLRDEEGVRNINPVYSVHVARLRAAKLLELRRCHSRHTRRRVRRGRQQRRSVGHRLRREVRKRRSCERRTGVVGDGHFEEAKALDVEPVGEVERRNGLGLAAGEAILRRV
jgi:hypothetical protein